MLIFPTDSGWGKGVRERKRGIKKRKLNKGIGKVDEEGVDKRRKIPVYRERDFPPGRKRTYREM